MEERRELWADIKNHYDSPVIKKKPWMVVGDFNETLFNEEHSSSSGSTPGMREFQEAVQYCSLLDSTSHGPCFTWNNRRAEGLISKKLDRVLINDHWVQLFPQSYSVFEGGGCSDHLRCRIQLLPQASKPKRPFKFVNVVAEMEQFGPMIKEFWGNSTPIYLSTSSMHRFTKKLKALKPEIHKLAKDRMGNLTKKSKEALEDLRFKQEQNLSSPSEENMKLEIEAAQQWEKVSNLEEKFLKQKSKLHWLQVGDKNNKVYHRAATVISVRNSIKEIVCGDGSVVKTEEEIKTEAERFFREFLQHKPCDFDGITVEELEQILPFRCSEFLSAELTKEVTSEEIQKVLFSMPCDRSLGPDGYTVEFFKAAWDTVGPEFFIAIKSFFALGFLPKGVNSTILALIPKRLEAREMKDYRPISFCNVLYKVSQRSLQIV